MVSEQAVPPARAYIHDGDGRRLVELAAPIGRRSYRSGTVGRATLVVEENDPALDYCDPVDGRLVVIESTRYPLVWAGPLLTWRGGPRQGTISLEARSYEDVVQRRYLPSGYTTTGSSGAVFKALHSTIEAESATGITLSTNVAAGEPFAGVAFGDLDLYRAWSLTAQQTAHEWYLEHAIAGGRLSSTAHFRPARGRNKVGEVTVAVGPQGNAAITDWFGDASGTAHRIRAIAGNSSVTDGFTDRPRVERRRGAAAPVAAAPLIARQNSRHGVTFWRATTGTTILSRREQLSILENVRSAGTLATVAEALLAAGRTVERVAQVELYDATMWAECTPGDLVRLMLPRPYFGRDGYDGPAAILDVEAVEEAGFLRLNVEVPSV